MVRLHKIEYAKMKYVVEYLWKKISFFVEIYKKMVYTINIFEKGGFFT